MISVQTFSTLNEAAGALDGQSRFFGGGTLLMRSLNYGEHDFSKLVRCNDAEAKAIRQEGDRIRIGGALTMSEIQRSPELAFLEPVARSVGSPAVRNMATVAGNIFAKHPYGDFTTAMLALDAMVSVIGEGESELETFLSGRDGFRGVVSSISIAVPSAGEFRYRKVSRVKPKGISVMSIAARLPMQGGRVQEPRIAFGAMADHPVRARGVEQALNGVGLEAGSIAPALDALSNDLQPPEDAIASSWYRAQVAPVHLRRLLLSEGGTL